MVNNQIETKNLKIRSFQKSDITEEYLSWLNDKELMKYSEQRHKNHTFESCLDYYESFKDSENYFFGIENKAKELLGTMTVYQDKNNRLFDIGIMIGSKKSRGKGFGYESWKAVMDWIEINFQPRKITAGAMRNNTAMIKIFIKSGMSKDGLKQKHYLYKNENVDVQYMAKFYF